MQLAPLLCCTVKLRDKNVLPLMERNAQHLNCDDFCRVFPVAKEGFAVALPMPLIPQNVACCLMLGVVKDIPIPVTKGAFSFLFSLLSTCFAAFESFLLRIVYTHIQTYTCIVYHKTEKSL